MTSWHWWRIFCNVLMIMNDTHFIKIYLLITFMKILFDWELRVNVQKSILHIFNDSYIFLCVILFIQQKLYTYLHAGPKTFVNQSSSTRWFHFFFEMLQSNIWLIFFYLPLLFTFSYEQFGMGGLCNISKIY